MDVAAAGLVDRLLVHDGLLVHGLYKREIHTRYIQDTYKIHGIQHIRVSEVVPCVLGMHRVCLRVLSSMGQVSVP